MSINKQAHPYKKHSGRIIVDEYEQIKRQREQESLCQFCRNQIPIRLMNSHRNVCAFGASFQSFDEDGNEKSRSEGKMACSTYTQKNIINKSNKDRGFLEQTPTKLASQRYVTRPNNSALSQKKANNKKVINLENGSVRNQSKNKNQRESCRKLSSSKNKNEKNGKIYENKKTPNMDKFIKKQTVNKSIVSDEYGEYFGSINKKRGASKLKKNAKNIWMEQSNKKKNKFRETEIKRQHQKHIREQKLKKLKNQTQKLKKEQEQLIRQLQKEKKNSRHQNTRNRSQIKRQVRQPSNNQRQIPIRARQNQPQQPNPSRNHGRNQQRYPTAQQSYYEQIPINHPHRTMNFISQTINQQFQMMKEQFEHMNEFFSNFVPFSHNGFVYFERGENSDYSVDSSGDSIGYEEEQQQKGLFEEQIQLLPRYTYIKKLGGDDQCAICISALKHQQIIRRLPCHHIFHSECIDEWLKRKAACPVCRDPIGDIGQ